MSWMDLINAAAGILALCLSCYSLGWARGYRLGKSDATILRAPPVGGRREG